MLKSIFSRITKLRTQAKTLLMLAWLRIPFGNVCAFRNGPLSVVVNKQMLVVISDGQSRDALPLMYVSPELMCKIAMEMQVRGYPVDLSAFPQELVEHLRQADTYVPVTA